MTSNNDSESNRILTASYEDTTQTQNFDQPLPLLAEDHSTEQKTAYLGSLRSAVTKMQEEINVFLTKKMEEDKASVNKPQEVDDAKEEENYGEEVVEE